jgi:hypothetical protein
LDESSDGLLLGDGMDLDPPGGGGAAVGGGGAGGGPVVGREALEDLAEQLLSLPQHSTADSLPGSLNDCLVQCLAHPSGLSVLRVDEWSQELVSLVCARASQLSLHPRSSESLARQLLLPALLSLTSTASRTLFGSCAALAQAFPQPTSRALLAGLLARPGAIQAPQSELIGRILSSEGCRWTAEVVGGSIREFFEASAAAVQPELWSEHCITMLSSLVGLGELQAATVLALARAADGQREAHKDSLKFAKLIHAAVMKNEPQARACAEIFLRVLRRLTSFLAKSAITALEKK